MEEVYLQITGHDAKSFIIKIDETIDNLNKDEYDKAFDSLINLKRWLRGKFHITQGEKHEPI